MAIKAVESVGGHFSATDTAADSTPSFVVFLDEVNTSSILGSVQDVMLDNALEGQPLPRNIFWVCATNPFRSVVEIHDPHGAAGGDVGFRAHYQVRARGDCVMFLILFACLPVPGSPCS